ncbi:keratin, type I cytoskeletal 19-like [Pseudophryne corroboree]|uniref:keratin, type I cytoskeletal 19-like n=1 Tax=Pseudophryne corroboree TaxID=495146 RepID=UPI0030818B6C
MSQSIKQIQSGSIKGSCQKSEHSTPVHQTGTIIYHHGESHPVPHGGHFRSPSVHGGSGGKGISLSRHFSHGCSFGNVYGYSHGNHFVTHELHGVFNNDGLFCFNEKETMQLLNNRLASYMEKVCSLEQNNEQLERNIREWYDRNQPNGLPDVSKFFKIIQELQTQIPKAHVENAKVFLDMDNAKMAADDIRNKFELEMRLRSNIEADVNGLRRVLERINMEICDLQMYIHSLHDELEELNKNHQEEVNCLRTQLGARVSVEVNAAPCVDLNSVLSDIRQQYESLMDRNLREVEEIFRARSEELNREMVSGAELLQSVNCNLIELKRCVQNLEIELQSQISMKCALEDSLAETEASFTSQLAQLQCFINNIESELAQIRCDLTHLNTEYKILMDQKNHLEKEIAAYKCLLEGHDNHAGSRSNIEDDRSVKAHYNTDQVRQNSVKINL